MGWQPIETAPKDVLIDIWLSDGVRWYSEPFYFVHPRTLDGGKMASTAIAAWEKNDE